ncbi:MAG: uroporphyrinogen decarboxylase family protein [Treponema sp.]|nr:uroporphyrinogen decarboxylase family protein [Treponema sp.]
MAGSIAHFTHMVSPLTHAASLRDIMEYPLPDPGKDYDWNPIGDKVENIKNSGLIAVAPMEFTLFELSWYIRGMEQFMIDLLTAPDLAEALLDRICTIRCETARRYAAAGYDVLRLGDDVSTQLDTMISPAQYRHFIKPRLKKVIDAAKAIRPEILIFYHGDGNLQRIIPDLIEAGVEILNPVQPECMDPVEIKKLYGDKLSFWGTLGTQTTMPFGTADEVRRVCREMIEKVGRGGGLFLAPTHVLEPEVPFENIEAFIETVTEYNQNHDP